MDVDINTTIDGTKATLEVAGKITVQTAVPLKAAITELPDEVKDIDIDVSGVSYLSSAGLRVFVLAAKLAMSRGGAMRLLHPDQDILDTLAMTGLGNVLTTVA